MRHVFNYTPALFSHKRKTCIKKLDFLLLSDPDGRLSVLCFFYSFKVFIPFQLETTINCLNQEDLGHSFAFSQNETKVQYAAPLKTGLCSIHNAVVF